MARADGSWARRDAGCPPSCGWSRTCFASSPGDTQWQARRTVEDLGLALQGSLLVRRAPAAVSDAFCAARLDGRGGLAFGTLPDGIDSAAILDRALVG